MPLYEYECKECGNVSEVIQSINEEQKKELYCNKCNKYTTVDKIITSMNFQLIGRGWAYDGYGNTYEHTKDLI